jgi:tripeptidyl-peptidase-1
MKFTATRAQISSLLNVQWATYYNKDEKKSVIRALGATVIPDHLDGTIDLLQGHRGWPTPATVPKKKKADGFGTTVTPAVIYEQYNETADMIPTTPAGMKNVQSFAQFQGQYVLASDLTSFCSTYLPGNNGTCKISKYIGGTDGPAPGVESSLDSEYIYATSYGAETWVYTYSGNDFCSDLLTWAQDVFSGENATHPNVISMSYGSQGLNSKGAYCEGSGATRLSVDTMKMGAMGISVSISSGDSGSAEQSRMGYNYGLLSPNFLASVPYCTAVGATSFVSGNSGEEKAAGFGSGGGFSFDYAQPEYQKAAVKTFLETKYKLPPMLSYNASGRGSPDVSFSGVGFWVISGGQYQGVGGTSCSSPSWGGMMSLLNNIRMENNKTLGFANPWLYSNPSMLTDITKGNNDVQGDGMGWYCTKG